MVVFWLVARWGHQARPSQCWVYRQAVTGPDTQTHTNARNSMGEVRSHINTQETELHVRGQVLLHHLQREIGRYFK